MIVFELRDKLNQLIVEGKGNKELFLEQEWTYFKLKSVSERNIQANEEKDITLEF